MLYEGAAETGAKLFDGMPYATSTLLTFLLGLGIVFVGLVALVLIVKLMSAAYAAARGKETDAPQRLEPRPAPASVSEPEPNHGELIAAVSAALATVMGKQVSGIRILSVKKVD